MVPQNKQIAVFIEEKLVKELSKKALVLEVCAGTGMISERLHKSGFNLMITDISGDSLKIAKHRTGLSEDKVVTANLLEFAPTNKYDALIESMGLDYFSEGELEQIAVKLLKAVKSGGYVILVDRHHYPAFENRLELIDKGSFDLDTPTGRFPYAYFVGKKASETL